ELWDAATLERVAGAYALLLEAVAVEAGRRVLDIPLMTDAERGQLLEEWNDTAAAYPQAPFHELVSEQAARTPGLPAVTSGAASLTYAELERASGRLANHLRRRGVGPETRVGICLERGVELPVAVLGVLKAGGAYVPLDPAYPAERLAFMLADSGAALLVSQASVVERLSGYAGETVRLDADAEQITAEAVGTPAAGTDPRSAAYVLYTSGSTGTPKGVVVEHGSLAHFVATLRRVFQPREGETVLALASFAFDIWVFEALVPLASGATVRVLPLERVREPAAVVEELRTAGMMNAVPSLMRSIVAAAREAGPDALAGVRWVFSGGEAVTPDLLAEMRDAFPGARRCVLYGPTEATVLATRYEVPADGGAGAAMLGGPLPNVRVYVLDGGGTPQPVGVPGELYVGGAGVARGYLGRPERTAERWVPDPFSGGAGTRLYRTGDRARWRADGELEYLGRLDDQVKIRGFRVELGEVEAVVGRHPAVRGVAAVVRGGSSRPDDVRIVAYLEADAGVSVAGVREHARASLPEFMVPATFVVLDALPLTPTGKVDRRALPEPEPAAAPADEEPRTELERAIAAVWAEVLGVPAVGVGTSFFELGGNSLLVVRAARLLESALGRGVRVLDLFEHVTVADLARHLSGAAASAPMGGARENRVEKLRAGKDGPGLLRQAVPVRPTGSERPLFLVHDGFGSVAYVQVLHHHVDEELPVYALPAASGEELPLRTVEGMATRLVRMVREVQPVGPYRLAGWSFGGILAYEMAAQLVGQDQAV
ncbi:MAG TPA: amino acid adenylation domain-containing protein, partial [Longimicrobiaceae bacterium]|nr:amino acid adenylation domain-containing protein [Longimicrobiaceae bacterium]